MWMMASHGWQGEYESAIHHMARTLQHDYNTQLAYAYMGQFEMVLHDQLGREEHNSTAAGWGLAERETLIQRAAEHLDVAIAGYGCVMGTYHDVPPWGSSHGSMGGWWPTSE